MPNYYSYRDLTVRVGDYECESRGLYTRMSTPWREYTARDIMLDRATGRDLDLIAQNVFPGVTPRGLPGDGSDPYYRRREPESDESFRARLMEAGATLRARVSGGEFEIEPIVPVVPVVKTSWARVLEEPAY